MLISELKSKGGEPNWWRRSHAHVLAAMGTGIEFLGSHTEVGLIKWKNPGQAKQPENMTNTHSINDGQNFGMLFSFSLAVSLSLFALPITTELTSPKQFSLLFWLR